MCVVLVFFFDDICEACFSVVLVQYPTVFAYQSEFDILLSRLEFDCRVCLCWCVTAVEGRSQ